MASPWLTGSQSISANEQVTSPVKSLAFILLMLPAGKKRSVAAAQSAAPGFAIWPKASRRIIRRVY
jgi:hypothetical protein